MNLWSYELRDVATHELLKKDSGFETESDAELQGNMEAKAENIKNYFVRTVQEWRKD